MSEPTVHPSISCPAHVASPAVIDALVQALDARSADAVARAVLQAADPPALLIIACDLIDSRVLADPENLAWADVALARLTCEAQSWAAARAASDPRVAQCRVMLSHSHALSYSNRFADAIEVLERLVSLATEAAAPLLAARGQMALIHPLSRLGRIDEAIAKGIAAREALARLAADGERASGAADPSLTLLIAKTDANLGVLHKANHDPRRALERFDLARPSFEAIPAAFAQLESNRGEALLELGAFDEAEQAFLAALSVLRSLQFTRAAAIVEGNLADLMGRLGRIADSTAAYERARRLHESVGAVGDLARLRAEQAELFAAAGMLVEARRELEEATSSLTASGLVAERNRATRALIRVLLRLGEPRAAERAWQGASDARRDGLEAGRWHAVDGEVHLARHRHDDAIAAFGRALPLLADRCVERCVVQALLASTELARGRYHEARTHIDHAVAEAQRLGLSPVEAECLAIRARIARVAEVAGGGAEDVEDAARSRRWSALADAQRAVELVERTRSSLHADRLRSAFAAMASSVHEEHLRHHLGDSSSNAAAVFAAIELGRHRSLLDCLAIATAPSLGQDADDDLDRESRRLHGVVNGLLSGVDRAADSAEFDSWRARLAVEEERLRVVEARRALRSRTPGDGRVASLAEVQAELVDDCALIEWCGTGERFAAVVVRRGSARVVELPVSGEGLRSAIEAFRFQVSRRVLAGPAPRFAGRMAQECVAALRTLDERLMAPLRSELDGVRHLHHVPCGDLHGVPFHALHDGQAFVIERCAVTTSPSASAMVRLAHRGRRQGPRLIVGVADERAPAIALEVRELASLWPDAIVLEGRDATVERVEREASRASVVHIAAHGRTPAGSPLSAGLALADQWWTVASIERCDLRGACVVLSACETGRALRFGGDETAGIFRAFLGAGASELVVSEWAASDLTTQRLMTSASRELAVGDPIEPAFRRAILESIGRGEHPAFWAPFQILGAPHPRARSTEGEPYASAHHPSVR